MKRLAIVLCLGLAACGGQSPVLRVPVPIACVVRSQIPPETPPVGELPEDARQAADLLGATLRTVRNEAAELRALLSGCAR